MVNPAVAGSPLVQATMDMSRLTTAAPAAIEPTAGQAMSRMPMVPVPVPMVASAEAARRAVLGGTAAPLGAQVDGAQHIVRYLPVCHAQGLLFNSAISSGDSASQVMASSSPSTV
ncbi:hypothetical protein OHA25_05770 [Nonomuraea sp. NBC_00507]|uniref:hypothetical protein n=1 Tax=Nonomuraea sp. NBC_00507 TaxID=2976002 RepID=UPI002E18A9BD